MRILSILVLLGNLVGCGPEVSINQRDRGPNSNVPGGNFQSRRNNNVTITSINCSVNIDSDCNNGLCNIKIGQKSYEVRGEIVVTCTNNRFEIKADGISKYSGII